MKIMIIDGYNVLHRARFGFLKGEYNVVFNFFRAIKPIIETIQPNKVIMVLEGYPKARYEKYPQYKANRRAEPEDLEKQKEIEDFQRQKTIILELLKFFPIEINYHPDYECDDVISVLVQQVYKDDFCTVVSNDTDFIQLFNVVNNFELYSPVKKEFAKKTDYDYVSWKALVGDTSDNVDGVPRIGTKTAVKLLEGDFIQWLDSNPEAKVIYQRNLELIQFAAFDPKEIVIEKGKPNFELVKEKFQEFDFSSVVEENAWKKYLKAFENLEV